MPRPRPRTWPRGEAEEGDEGREEEGGEQQQDVGELSFDLEPAARPSEEEVRQEMLSMFPGGAGDSEATVFAVTMLCMAEGAEPQVWMAHNPMI